MPSKVGVYGQSGTQECEAHVGGDVRKRIYDDNYARITSHSVGHGRDLEATSDSTVTTARTVAGQQNAGPMTKDAMQAHSVPFTCVLRCAK